MALKGTNNADLENQASTGGAFIPLSGTVAGSPISGDLTLESNVAIKNQSGEIFILGNQNETYFQIGDTPEGISVISSNPLSKGLVGNNDLSANYDNLTYVQKVYVDNSFIPLTGTTTGNPVTGNIEFSDSTRQMFRARADNSKGIFQFGGGDESVLMVYQNDTTGATTYIGPTTNGIYIFNSGNSGQRGLIGLQDFSANITNLDYPQKIYVDKIRPYKVYTALLTQTGTNAPVPTILENTIGNIVWVRFSEGVYRATLDNAFTGFKTISFLTLTRGSFLDVKSRRLATDVVQIEVTDINGNFQEYSLTQTGPLNIEIRVYN